MELGLGGPSAFAVSACMFRVVSKDGPSRPPCPPGVTAVSPPEGQAWPATSTLRVWGGGGCWRAPCTQGQGPCGPVGAGTGVAWHGSLQGQAVTPGHRCSCTSPLPGLTHRDSAGRWQEGPTRSVHRQPEARQEEAPWTREASVVRAETRAPHSRGGIPPQTASHQERPGPTRAACGQHQDHQGAYALGGGAMGGI